ncbi:Ribosomal-protein-serine acetyltransferase [Anaerotruncus sp. 2789STDY5834896]|uniref:Ribosomal-protein-serine acetyltransferase n=1 Tax=uncultured Anaerotruncus sp. TaxID=905011 RepID=A0A1C6JKB6_9FIRM|nr:Ribosomal-protein-serine acetyltransferase [uncultured Anaerotruncus sp.]
MTHQGTVTIYTDRLCLRRFTAADSGAMYKNWASDERVIRFLTWPAHASSQVTAQVVAGWLPSYDRADFYQWAICLRDGGEPIGSISAVDQQPVVCGVEIGYCLGHRWWGQGLMTEALAAIIDFFFIRVGFLRIAAGHDLQNPASGRVMVKCGMRREGTLRQAGRNNTGIVDMAVYSILAAEHQKHSGQSGADTAE